MTRVAVVGAGLIGRAWSVVFARAGMEVNVWDRDPAVRERFAADFGAMAEMAAQHGLAGDDPDHLPERIQVQSTLAAAVTGCDLVQESGPEDLATKRQLFSELDRLAPSSAVIASSSSSLNVSLYASGLEGVSRCLVGHPVNPPHLVPVVELSPGPDTSPETIKRAEAVYRAAGQVPVSLAREVDGFILNRLQAVVLAESLRLIAEGVVSVEGLEDTIRHGLGRRWAFMGPMETIALNAPGGVKDYIARYGPMMARLANDCARGEAFTENAAEAVHRHFSALAFPDAVRARSQWRDGELAALERHFIDRRTGMPAREHSADSGAGTERDNEPHAATPAGIAH